MNNIEGNPAEIFTTCGGRITEALRYPSAQYRGKTVYFCTQACLKAFQKDPDPFIAGEIEHPEDSA